MLCQFQVYSKVNQLYICMYPLFFRFFSHLGYYRVLSRVSCAIEQVLISCPFYMQQCVRVNPKHLSYPPPLFFPFGNHKIVFHVYESVSVLCYAQSLSRVRLFVTPRTAAHQAPLSMGFSRQEYWNGLPWPSPNYMLANQLIS